MTKDIIKLNSSSRGNLLRLNIVSGLFVKGCSMLLSMLFIPLVLGWLGKYSYGIWLALSSIVGWLGMLDLGLSGGLRMKLQESIAKGDWLISKKYISTTYILLGLISLSAFCLVSVVLLLSNPDLCSFFKVGGQYSSDLDFILFFSIACFFLRLILQPISTVLLADQRNFIQSFIFLTENIINFLGILVFQIFFPRDLVMACVLFSISPVVNLLIYSVVLYSTRYRNLLPSFRCYDKAMIKPLMNLSVDIFIITASLLLIVSMNNFVITKFFSPDDVTKYNLVYKVYATIGTLFTIIMTPLWSAFADAYAKKDYTWIHSVFKKVCTKYVYFIFIYIFFIIVGPYAVKIWSGVEVNEWLLYIFSALYFIVQSFMTIYAFLFNGMGEIKIQRNMALYGAIVNVPLACIFITCFDMGVEAVLIANIISILPAVAFYPLKARTLLYSV